MLKLYRSSSSSWENIFLTVASRFGSSAFSQATDRKIYNVSQSSISTKKQPKSHLTKTTTTTFFCSHLSDKNEFLLSSLKNVLFMVVGNFVDFLFVILFVILIAKMKQWNLIRDQNLECNHIIQCDRFSRLAT